MDTDTPNHDSNHSDSVDYPSHAPMDADLLQRLKDEIKAEVIAELTRTERVLFFGVAMDAPVHFRKFFGTLLARLARSLIQPFYELGDVLTTEKVMAQVLATDVTPVDGDEVVTDVAFLDDVA